MTLVALSANILMEKNASGSVACPASSMEVRQKWPLGIPISERISAETQVVTITLKLFIITIGGTETFGNTNANGLTISGIWCLNWHGATTPNSSSGFIPAASLSVIRSAAELLGAHARILALGRLCTSCRILLTIVIVFPVPGLRSKIALASKSSRGGEATYSPKTTKGGDPARWLTIQLPAPSCAGLPLISRLNKLIRISLDLGFRICFETGNRMRSSVKKVFIASCWRLTGIQFNMNLIWYHWVGLHPKGMWKRSPTSACHTTRT